jgi:hypothetical protein
MNKNFKNMTISAVASAIAGAYYLYGSRDGEAKRKQVNAWAIKMKGDVLEGIEKLKVVSEPTYKAIVKKVSQKFQQQYKKIDKTEIKKVTDELQATWNKMKKEVAAEVAKRDEMIRRENEKMAKQGKSIKTKSVKSKKTSIPVKKAPTKKVKVETVKEEIEEIKIENTENGQ